jgi:hypothetical protein
MSGAYPWAWAHAMPRSDAGRAVRTLIPRHRQTATLGLMAPASGTASAAWEPPRQDGRPMLLRAHCSFPREALVSVAPAVACALDALRKPLG